MQYINSRIQKDMFFSTENFVYLPAFFVLVLIVLQATLDTVQSAEGVREVSSTVD